MSSSGVPVGDTGSVASSSSGASQLSVEETHELKPGKREKVRAINNVLVISVAFMLHFTAFQGTANLQSSINLEAGTYSLLSIYSSFMIACIFLPVLVIRWLGLKWSMSLAFITYMPFVAAQFYPRSYTLIPTGVAIGIGASALWCSKATYLTVVAEAFSVLTNNSAKSKVFVVRFFGIFYFFFQTAQVWGNLISSSVLSRNAPETRTSTNNLTNISHICGVNFCPGVTASENPLLTKPEAKDINLLAGIYLAFMASAVLLVSLGVDSEKRYNSRRQGSGEGLTGFKLLIVTAKQLVRPKQLLLVPVTFFLGFDIAFVSADLTAGFFGCAWGISNIGYAMVCFGVANAIGSAWAAFLTKFIGRFTIVSVTACVHVALVLWLTQWQPQGDGLFYCGIASVWGAVNGIWLVQINALSGVIFPGNEEAAFSIFRFIMALGSSTAYALSPVLCMRTKLWALVTLIAMAMVGYSVVEGLERTARRNSKRIEQETAGESENSDNQRTSF